jgi:hypothetical protein
VPFNRIPDFRCGSPLTLVHKSSRLKKISLLIFLGFFMFSCKPSADRYFGTAALNCNTFSRFGSYEIKEFLAGPPQTYNIDKKVMEPSSFQEYFRSRCVDNAIEKYEKVKSLPVTDETRSMIKASLALYEFCVSKYQNEYIQIAKMKDDHRTQPEIDAALKSSMIPIARNLQGNMMPPGRKG